MNARLLPSEAKATDSDSIAPSSSYPVKGRRRTTRGFRKGLGRRLFYEAALAKSGRTWLTGFVLASCVLFGGATRSGSLGDIVLQYLSIPLLLVAARAIVVAGSARRLLWPLIFVGVVLLVPTAQLLPLPHNVWMRLPGRKLIVETYVLMNQPIPMLPLTMTPEATWLSGLSLLPPIAVFTSVLTLDSYARRTISRIVIGLAVAATFLGLLQLAHGPNSVLRFYAITNRTEAVGFFANRNHFAALMYVAMLFVCADFIDAALAAGRMTHRGRIDINAVVAVVTWATAFVILLAGEMMARSRAGLALSTLALIGGLCFCIGDRRLKVQRRGSSRLILMMTGAALLSFAPLTLYRISERLGSDPSVDARIPFARNTFAAAMTYMPFGSGLGSFVPVYQIFEKWSDIGLTYANHAHNDFLEVWLETGIFGIALIVIFVIWLVRRTVRLWLEKKPRSGHADLFLQRAAAVTLILLLAHSLFDYPLRTTAMMSVAAMAAGLLFDAPDRENRRPSTHPTAVRIIVRQS